MKFVFLTAGLAASMIACPWFVAQEPNLGKSEKQVDATSSQLPSGYTEGTRYEYENRYRSESAAVPGLPSGHLALPPGQGNGAFNSSGMIAAWEMENGKWVLKYQQIQLAELTAAYRQAYQAYQAAADDAAKSKASAELKANLEKQYDLFVEGQKKQIEDLEARLAKLTEQLDKRRAAKERVVELKLQMVLSQAEGLGFPDNGYPNGATMFGQSPYQTPLFEKLNAYPAQESPALLPPAPVPLQTLPPMQTLPPATAPAPQLPGADPFGGQNKTD